MKDKLFHCDYCTYSYWVYSLCGGGTRNCADDEYYKVKESKDE